MIILKNLRHRSFQDLWLIENFNFEEHLKRPARLKDRYWTSSVIATQTLTVENYKMTEN